MQATAAGARHRSAWRPQASSTIGTCRPPAAAARPHGPTTWRQPGAPPATAARPAAARSTCRPAQLVATIGRPGARAAHRLAARRSTSGSSSINCSAIHLQATAAGARHRSAWRPQASSTIGTCRPPAWPARPHALATWRQPGAPPAAAARPAAARSTCRPARLVATIGRPGARTAHRLAARLSTSGSSSINCSAIHLQATAAGARHRSAWRPQASSTIGTCRPPAPASMRAVPGLAATRRGTSDSSSATCSAIQCRPSAPASSAAWPDHLAATRCTTSCCSSASRSAIHVQAGAAGGRHRSTRCTHTPARPSAPADHQLLQLDQPRRNSRADRRRRPARPHGPTTWRQPGAPPATIHVQAGAAGGRHRSTGCTHTPARPSAPADHQPGQRGRMPWPPGGNQVHHQLLQLDQPQRDPRADRRRRPPRPHGLATWRQPGAPRAAAARPAAARSTCRPARLVAAIGRPGARTRQLDHRHRQTTSCCSSTACPDHLAATRCTTSCCSAISCSAIHVQAGAAGGHHRSTRCTHTPARPSAPADHQPGQRGRMPWPPGGNQVHHQLLQLGQLQRDPHAGHRGWCTPSVGLAPTGQLDHRHLQTTSLASAAACPGHLAATRCTTSCCSSTSRSAIHVQTVGADRRGRMAWPPGGNQVHHELLQLGQPQRDPRAGRRGWWPPSVDRVHAHASSTIGTCRPPAAAARPHALTTWQQPGSAPAAAARSTAARSTCRPPRLVHAIGRPGAHRPARPSAPADHQPGQRGRMP